MRSSELREKFLKYFEENGHKRLASAPLVPQNDPTLFFTNAGMVQFKETFLGQEKRPYKRAVTSQKCLRVSGKHNDLEQVGLTQRHHTFFEMLGNFSFGDYFKKEAIAFGWEFLTKVAGIPKDRLYITVFEDDDEAEKLWSKIVDKDRIFRLGEKDNFWSMGETGPCGPCSEIHYDKVPGTNVTKSDFETSRFMEIWNLVFMQFNRNEKGELTKLAKPSIDTGMGLERLAAVVEGVEGNYETDLFRPIIAEIEKVTGQKYTATYEGGGTKEEGRKNDFSIRVIADHIRSSTFLVADGIVPSNEGRGYVLRRIIRRAIRHAHKLGQKKPFFGKLAHTVIDEMGSAYPELIQHRSFIEKILSVEEERFSQTIDKGLELLNGEFEILAKKKNMVVPGEVIFKLYDTFGFPKDLTADIAKERGMSLDDKGFDRLMEGQREKARQSWKGSGEEKVDGIFTELKKKGIATKFVGYEHNSCKAKVVAVVAPPSSPSPSRGEGKGEGDRTINFVTDTTPFYGESGGQVGDTGMAVADGLELEIVETKKPLPEIIVHTAKVIKGELKEGMTITLGVDAERRDDIRRNHTATHLLHKSLQKILGEHIKQAGSLVGPDRLRFDFSHFQGIPAETLRDIESEVNSAIRNNLEVTTTETSYDEAVKRGAMALFGEKYGDSVRLVEAKGFSAELCGGTHVNRTGDIGFFKLISESGVASGVRRIEAISGRGAVELVQKLDANIKNIAGELRSSENDILPRIKKMSEKLRSLEKDLAKGASSQSASSAEIKEINGVKTIIAKVEAGNVGDMRTLADNYKQKLGSGVIVLASIIGEKVAVIVCVSSDLTGKFKAGDIVKKLSTIVGGTGGGRPDMAQGGGPDIGKIDEMLAGVQSLIA